MKIVVLMSTYNGERYLNEQIDSILAQDIAREMELELMVRDDGSSDSTHDILDAYQNQGLLKWYTGENLRPAKSFWDLLKKAPKADFYAFADQDDYWFTDKLSRAVSQLRNHKDNDYPLLYCSAVTTTDASLNPFETPQEKLNSFCDFSHALLYSTAQGCTFVFNNVALRELVRYDMEKDYVLIHDWLAHKIITMMGKMIYDEKPSMYYRQHGGNVIGNQKPGISSFVKRFMRFIKGSQGIRSDVARSLMEVYKKQLDVNSDNYRYLSIVANYKNNRMARKEFLMEKAFRTGTINDLFLYMLIILRKI